MEPVILVNGAILAVALWLAVRWLGRARASFDLACERIGEPDVPDEVRLRFTAAARTGSRHGLLAGLLVVLLLIVIAPALALVLTDRVEPRATGILLFFAAMVGGLGVAGAVIAFAFVIRAAIRNATCLRALRHESDGEAVLGARNALRGVPAGTIGVTGLGVAAGIVSLLLGLGTAAILFYAATAAITCARDPKCL